ncbi:MAG: hypothetical protein AB7T19_18200, partial [Planctomycetota bacterium]
MVRILAFLLLLAGIGTALYITREKETVNVVDARAVLGGRRLGDAEWFRLRRDAKTMPIEFELHAEGWMVTEPVRDRASVAVIEALGNAVDQARLVPAYPAAEVTETLLVETGLDTPRGELEVRYSDGVTLALAIGAPGPLGGDLFARRTEPGADG